MKKPTQSKAKKEESKRQATQKAEAKNEDSGFEQLSLFGLLA